MKQTMGAKAKKRGRRWPILLAVILGIGAAMVGAFWIYCSSYYPADEEALAVLVQQDGIVTEDRLTILYPSSPSETAIIFYPGAKVEETAYLPLLEQLRQSGVTCILVKMPLHMAILDADAAAKVIPQFPEIKYWYLAGHSMGGAMASQYAANHGEQLSGLILLGAYPYGEYPVEDTLTVYGSLNTSVAQRIDYTENVVVIEGGNHAQFGNYGPQKGDAPAEISAEEQQRQTVHAIVDFLADNQTQ